MRMIEKVELQIEGKKKFLSILNKYQYIIVFLIGFFFSIINVNCGINFIDEGFNLNSMNKIINGLIPYKDFSIIQTPGHLYLGALVMLIFGKSILALRVFTALTSSAFSLVVFYFIKKMTNTTFAYIGFFISIVFGLSMSLLIPSYSWNAMLLGSISIISFVKSLQNDKMRWIILTGTLLGLTVLFKQSIGVYFIVGYCITFLFLRIYKKRLNLNRLLRKFLFLSLSTLVLGLIFVVYLILNNAWEDFIKNAVIAPLTSFMGAKLPTPSLVELITIFTDFSPWNFAPWLFFLQITVLFASFIIFIRKIYKKDFDLNFSIIFFFACTSFLHNYERFSFLKIRTTLPLCVILLLFLIYSLYKHKIKTVSLSFLFSVDNCISVWYYIKIFS